MNIFYYNHNQEICAQQHCDKHVVKMIVEYAQIMSTTHRVVDNSDNPLLYKQTHVNHPSVIWCRYSRENYEWLYGLFIEVCKEYTYRYGKIHATEVRLKSILSTPPKGLESSVFIEPTPAMSNKYIVKNDSIQSYINQFNYEKSHLASWKNRNTPNWFIPLCP